MITNEGSSLEGQRSELFRRKGDPDVFLRHRRSVCNVRFSLKVKLIFGPALEAEDQVKETKRETRWSRRDGGKRHVDSDEAGSLDGSSRESSP